MFPPRLTLLLTLLSLTLTSSPTSGTLQHLTGDRYYSVDVNVSNFDQVLRDTPATYAVVGFFANWCPACQKYKSQYEKVARLFNGPDAAHPGILLMTRVECGSRINTKLCFKFSATHYPMLFWGPASKFVAGSYDPRKAERDFLVIDEGRTADHLLDWINQELGSSYNLDDQKFGNVHPTISDFTQIAQAMFDVEEATATAFDIIFKQNMIKSETRASIINFLQLLVVHHPSRRCRRGSAEILVNFDDLFPPDMMSYNKLEDLHIGDKKGAVGNVQICGNEFPRGHWMFCSGSRNDSGGFSCGLWVLLHSLSVRIEDRESQNAFMTICNFIHDFFMCEECRQLFYGMCSSASIPFKKTHDFALWLWSAHNKVNERLMKEEASLGTGAHTFPKITWPPSQLCTSCYQNGNNRSSQIDWNQEEVFKFLTSYYSKALVSMNKDKDLDESEMNSKVVEEGSTNAVVVPVGAALAIALASCAFGALACFWRAKQKNRKIHV